MRFSPQHAPLATASCGVMRSAMRAETWIRLQAEPTGACVLLKEPDQARRSHQPSLAALCCRCVRAAARSLIRRAAAADLNWRRPAAAARRRRTRASRPRRPPRHQRPVSGNWPPRRRPLRGSRPGMSSRPKFPHRCFPAPPADNITAEIVFRQLCCTCDRCRWLTKQMTLNPRIYRV